AAREEVVRERPREGAQPAPHGQPRPGRRRGRLRPLALEGEFEVGPEQLDEGPNGQRQGDEGGRRHGNHPNPAAQQDKIGRPQHNKTIWHVRRRGSWIPPRRTTTALDMSTMPIMPAEKAARPRWREPPSSSSSRIKNGKSTATTHSRAPPTSSPRASPCALRR